jgi:hypothetical protein
LAIVQTGGILRHKVYTIDFHDAVPESTAV